MSIDARVAYDVWRQVISDEELYRAMLDGTHHELAASRALGSAELAVLDALRAERGTQWNIENLRFRSAHETSARVMNYLPRTVRMLTGGDENWLQDICFEYLAYYRWIQLGHHALAECERFGAYVRDRIMKRRVTPPHLDSVLTFELGVVRLLKRTAEIPPDQWPTAPAFGDLELASARLGRAAAVELIDLPVDLRAWVESADPSCGAVRPGPVTFLVYVPSLQHTHRIKILGEGPRLVLDRLTGERTTGAVVSELVQDHGFEPPDLFRLVRNWLEERVLAVVPDR